MYAFTLNNPMAYVDPDGRNPCASDWDSLGCTLKKDATRQQIESGEWTVEDGVNYLLSDTSEAAEAAEDVADATLFVADIFAPWSMMLAQGVTSEETYDIESGEPPPPPGRDARSTKTKKSKSKKKKTTKKKKSGVPADDFEPKSDAGPYKVRHQQPSATQEPSCACGEIEESEEQDEEGKRQANLPNGRD